METISRTNRSFALMGAATVAVLAMGFSTGAHARDSVFWSVGVGTPGAVFNVGNVGSVYPQPVYVQPQPVYVQPQPVYVQPSPVYYPQRPVFVRPAPVYVAPPEYHHRPHGHGYGHRYYDGRYAEAPRPVYGPGYAPGYQQGYAPVYQQGGRNSYRY